MPERHLSLHSYYHLLQTNTLVAAAAPGAPVKGSTWGILGLLL